ncbi:MAG TPA: transposase [Gemmataceae bacterium]|nr:transposase [Gemmataceae bacterium]
MLKDLAAYTHRVALSNHRLEKLEAGRVTFRSKDYADGHKPKRLTVAAEEFLRCFVQHGLPRGFVKVRHYGLLANRRRPERLAVGRRLLLVEAARAARPQGGAETLGVEPARQCCRPHCGGNHFLRLPLPADEVRPTVRSDSS